MGQELRLQWTPNSGLKSEVVGKTINVYEVDETRALDRTVKMTTGICLVFG